MPSSRKGLGRGLDALFQKSSDLEPESGAGGYRLVSLQTLEPNPNQPRKRFSTESLQELAQSIKEQGLLQPILVRPSPQNPDCYQIVAGERRWRACQLAELHEVPVLVSELSDSESMALGLMENLQREDLDPMEEAEGLFRLQELTGFSQEELSQKVGKSRSGTANSLRLLKLEPEIQEAVREGRIGASQARNLLGIDDSGIRQEVFQLLLDSQLTIRDLESVVDHYKRHGCLPEYLRGKPPAASRSKPDSSFRDLKRHIQQAISERLKMPARIRGTREKGTLSFSYSSREELARLLQTFGLEEASDVSRETKDNE